MTKRSLLLVDGDAKSLRVLEVSLRKAGFTVSTAESGPSALQLLESMQPDLVISDTDMPGMDGYEFCRQFKAKPEWQEVPFIFLTGQTEIADKIRGLELGVDDYLTKPIYIKEILTRVRILLQKRDRARFEQKKENNTRFAGQLSDMGVVDLIQTIEVSRKTGVIHFRADEKRQATMFFKEGQVIDAESGHLQGEDAVYRLLTWSEGEFEALFRPVRRKAVIAMSSQSLLMEGMRRLDEWGRLQEQLPPLSERFQVVYDELWDRLAELPDDINQILRLFDTRRTLQEVIDGAEIGDLETIEVISKLYFEGIIVEVDQDKGLKSGSYPVEDLVLQARAASESAASRDRRTWSETPTDAARTLAAIEGELQEETEQDASARHEPPRPDRAPGDAGGPVVLGLLEQAITAATPVTAAQGKSKPYPNPKRSTARGVAVAPLPPAKQVDSENTEPTLSSRPHKNLRPKTMPMHKMTPKEELDASARLAEKQAASITSPVADADIQAQLAEREAASITTPIEDAVSKARRADLAASELGQKQASNQVAGQIHIIAGDTDSRAPLAAATVRVDVTGAAAAAGTPAPGEEYEADLDDLGDIASLDEVTPGDGSSLDEVSFGASSSLAEVTPGDGSSLDEVSFGASTSLAEVTPGDGISLDEGSPGDASNADAATASKGDIAAVSNADIALAAARIAAAAEAAAAKVPVGATRATHDRVDVSSNRAATGEFVSEEESVGETTAEIFQKNLRAAEPPMKSPVLWYLLAAAAAGFLGFVAIKSMSKGDAARTIDGQSGILPDGPAGKTVVTPVNPLAPDTGRKALEVPSDARAAVASAPADARAAVAVVPADARVAVTVAPADARAGVALVPPDARAAVALVPPDARAGVALVPADARTSSPPLGIPTAAEPSPDELIKALQQQARKAKRQGDSDAAIVLLDQALAIKRTGTTLYQKAELLISQGKPAKALEVAKELTRVSPRRAQGWRILGLASYEAEDYAGARKAFGRYLELSPNARDRDDVRTLLESM